MVSKALKSLTQILEPSAPTPLRDGKQKKSEKKIRNPGVHARPLILYWLPLQSQGNLGTVASARVSPAGQQIDCSSPITNARVCARPSDSTIAKGRGQWVNRVKIIV